MIGAHDMIYGVRIVQNPLAVKPRKMTVPVFALRPWINVSDEFRREMDEWLSTFGNRTEEITHGEEPCAYMIHPSAAGLYGGPTLVVHPSLYAALRKTLNAGVIPAMESTYASS